MDEVGAENRIHDSTGKRKIGISDLLFLAYNSMKREAAGKPVKPMKHGVKLSQILRQVAMTQKLRRRKHKSDSR
jgi:hypothetical protein